MIKIIDCGTGNVSALLNCYKELNIQAERALVPKDLEIATHIVLPGVGSFDRVINKINKSGFSGIRHPILDTIRIGLEGFAHELFPPLRQFQRYRISLCWADPHFYP